MSNLTDFCKKYGNEEVVVLSKSLTLSNRKTDKLRHKLKQAKKNNDDVAIHSLSEQIKENEKETDVKFQELEEKAKLIKVPEAAQCPWTWHGQTIMNKEAKTKMNFQWKAKTKRKVQNKTKATEKRELSDRISKLKEKIDYNKKHNFRTSGLELELKYLCEKLVKITH